MGKLKDNEVLVIEMPDMPNYLWLSSKNPLGYTESIRGMVQPDRAFGDVLNKSLRLADKFIIRGGPATIAIKELLEDEETTVFEKLMIYAYISGLVYSAKCEYIKGGNR